MYQIIKQLLEDIDEMNYRYQHVKLMAVHSIFIKMLNLMSKILIII